MTVWAEGVWLGRAAGSYCCSPGERFLNSSSGNGTREVKAFGSQMGGTWGGQER